MADEASILSANSGLISGGPKHADRVLLACGFLLIAASIFSFAGVAAITVWGAVNSGAYPRWLDFLVNASVSITLLVAGMLTAILATRLLGKVRWAGARTILAGGDEQPRFFALVFREAGQGPGYSRTIREGSEADLRAFMADGGIPEAAIDDYFHHAHSYGSPLGHLRAR